MLASGLFCAKVDGMGLDRETEVSLEVWELMTSRASCCSNWDAIWYGVAKLWKKDNRIYI
jgi:hypothetical protein